MLGLIGQVRLLSQHSTEEAKLGKEKLDLVLKKEVI